MIEDICDDNKDSIIERMMKVYSSWISDAISDYNTDFFYQSREYICECYKEGRICA